MSLLTLNRNGICAYPVRLPDHQQQQRTNSVPESSDNPKYIHATCKVCGTRVTPKAKNAGRRLKCPDCESPIQLPTMEQFLAMRREQALREPRQPEPVEPYVLQEKFERADALEHTEATVSVFRELARIKREEAPSPPASTFFSNVFEFPWKTSDALIRWGLLAAGFSLAGIILALNLWMRDEYGFAGMVGSGFFVLAQIAFAVWSMAYASSCLMSILHDTSAGLDRVEGWPDGGVFDWMSDLLAVGYLFLVSGFVSLIPAKALEPLIGFQSPLVLVVQAFVFPIALVGGLDAESIWLPWSGTVVRSLKTIPRDWLIFYGLTLVVAGVGNGFLLACLIKSYWLFGVMLGPVLASQCFIFARLIGRLAWRIGETAVPDDDDDDD
ncbi:hypothetical protein GC176_05295 [bacterium]|nr:hypothetical protein [bacterium]